MIIEDEGVYTSPVHALQVFPALHSMLEQIDAARLAEIEAKLEYFGVPAGTVLFREGDAAPDAYIVITGRLGVFVGTDTGAPPIAEVSSGEIVGEMALLSDDSRSASVIALRDSDLVRVPQHVFEMMTRSSPQISLLIMRLLAERLKRTSHSHVVSRTARNVAIVPVGGALKDPAFVPSLAEAFSALSRRVTVIDRDRREEETERLLSGGTDLDLLLYVGDATLSAWSRRCIRQSDHVIFVSDAGSQAETGSQAVAYARELHRQTELVLINPPGAVLPSGGTAWLALFPSDRINHIRAGSGADVARIARLALGRGIGVVFSGGGARGFAHLGVIKAFYESGIPIDLVGGTSFGAMLAGAVAMGLDADAVAKKVHHAFVENTAFADYTLPIFSLARGRRMNQLLRHHFGDAWIENLWRTFFCVSANLSTGKLVVHQTGLMWHGLRGTGAVPGLLPPHLVDGQILVDGGLMDNFPTSVMRSLRRGLVVGVEVTSGSTLTAQASAIEDKSLLWMLTKGRKQVPGILKILMRSGTINGEAQTIASRAAADVLIQPPLESFDMLSWHAFDRIVEVGYRAGMDAVKQIQSLLSKTA